MKSNQYRKFALVFIKYAPAIMAITCALKILLLTLNDDTPLLSSCISVNIVNIFIDVFIVLGLYFIGKTFHYCWKHRSLCRTAIYGYIFYTIFLLTKIQSEIVLPLAALYILIVVILVVVYKGC